jgi:hypothetical protein
MWITGVQTGDLTDFGQSFFSKLIVRLLSLAHLV